MRKSACHDNITSEFVRFSNTNCMNNENSKIKNQSDIQ